MRKFNLTIRLLFLRCLTSFLRGNILPCPRKPSTTYLPWIGKSYLGIDKGLVILMFENYSTQLIWKLLHQNKSIQKGLKTLEFTQVGNGVE